jgi:hypothetical protein
MHGTNLCENREVLCSAFICVSKARVVNSKEVRP